MRQVYSMICALLSVASMHAYRGDYQKTINRAQMNRSRSMGYGRGETAPVRRSMTGRPLRGSYFSPVEQSQNEQAQMLMSDMSEM